MKVVASVVLLVLVFACSPTRTISGTFTLTSTSVAWTPADCHGTGGYSDVRSGLGVTIKDGSGTIVGTGAIVEDPTGSSAGRCHYTFAVPVGDVAFYSLEIGHRGALTYSREELVGRDWKVDVTLGD